MKKVLLSSAIALAFASMSAIAGDLATVNGKSIPDSTAEEVVQAAVARGAKDTPELRAQIKESLILQEVLVQEAEKQDIASKDEVKKQLDNIRRGALVNGLHHYYVKDNAVSDSEVVEAYNKLAEQLKTHREYHIKHILVSSEAEANAIIKQLARGNFDKIAKAKSLDKNTSANGGDLGWVPLDPNQGLGQILAGIKKGGYTKTALQGPNGWEIFKVMDSRKATLGDLDQVKPKLKASMEQAKWQEYVTTLRKKADVK